MPFNTLEEAQAEFDKLEAKYNAQSVELEAAKKAVTTPPEMETLVAAKVTEAIADIKVKLDKAYAARDDALAKNAEFERKANEAVKAQLLAEGKHKELSDMQIAEKDAKIKDLEKANTELARNNEVRSALAAVEFRNDKAAEIAFKEITSELVRNEQGVWAHASGKSIREFVGEFVKDESQSFLLKPRTNNGGGNQGHEGGGGDQTKGKSVFGMDVKDVLKAAERGELPHQRNR